MLILTRCVTQVICLGHDIKIAILGVKGRQVRIGIEAPSSVAVHREEIYDRINAGLPAPERPPASSKSDAAADLERALLEVQAWKARALEAEAQLAALEGEA